MAKEKRLFMISVGTYLVVADNSNAKMVKCIKILGKGSFPKQVASVGDVIVVSIKQIKAKHHGTKINRGDIYKAVIVETKCSWKRKDGSVLKGSRNAVVLLNVQLLPLGTRVLSWVTSELRYKNHMKILSLSSSVL